MKMLSLNKISNLFCPVTCKYHILINTVGVWGSGTWIRTFLLQFCIEHISVIEGKLMFCFLLNPSMSVGLKTKIMANFTLIGST